MENYSTTYFDVDYIDIDKYDHLWTNSRTFLSLSKARDFAKKVVSYGPIEIVQKTTTVLERIEPDA